MIALLTAVYDNYDPLHPVVGQSVDHTAICVTDNPDLTSDTWQIVYEPRPGVHPNLAAKQPKMCPWRYTDADLTVWVDAAFTFQSSDFLAAMGQFTFGQFAHPWRDCIYDERAASGHPKYAGLPLDSQVDYYRQRGHPEHWGLWATGLIVRRHTPQVERFGEAWLAECERWSFQDQLSEPPLLREFGLRPETIPGCFRQGENPWVSYSMSSRH